MKENFSGVSGSMNALKGSILSTENKNYHIFLRYKKRKEKEKTLLTFKT